MTSDRIYYSHDAERHAMRARAVLTLLCLAVGLGVGAIFALLFAPSSGKKTRHNLAESVGEGLNSGRETVEPLVKRAEEQINELHKSIEERLKHA